MSKQSQKPFFAMTDFRDYIHEWAKTQGRGEFRRLALALDMHTTLMSQIMNGRKCFTEEQACRLCDHMKLNNLETDYFVKLVQIERAGSETLKNLYRRQLLQIAEQGHEIKHRVPTAKSLNAQDRFVFYSSWQYSLVRIFTSIENYQTAESLSRELNLPLSRVQEILNFLTSRGLCAETKGRYSRTETNTHIEATSPLAIRHHQNWRAKSSDFHERMTSSDLAFTAPVSVAKKDISKVRNVLVEAIADIAKIVEDSKSENVVYLGIDWIKL